MTHYVNIILFGAPGAGKGTQSEFLVKKYNLKHISTGNLLRKEKQDETPLGAIAARCELKGELVPDEIVIGMVKNFILANPDVPGFLFDGFPRTLDQAKALDAMLKEARDTQITRLILLDVPRHVLIARLQKRAEIEQRPDDQDLSVIERRLEIYHDVTEPIQSHYAQQKKVSIVNGNQDPAIVSDGLSLVMDLFFSEELID